MKIAAGSTLSALQSFGNKMAVHSNNVANVESDDFNKSRAIPTEGAIKDQVTLQVDEVDTQGPVITETYGTGETVERELSNVDLAEEFPQTIATQNNYAANIKTIQTQDQMLGTVLDMKS